MNVLFLPAFSFVLCLSSLIGVEGSCHECPPDSKCVVDNCVCYVGYSWNDPVTKQSCIKDPPSTTTPVPTTTTTTVPTTTTTTVKISTTIVSEASTVTAVAKTTASETTANDITALETTNKISDQTSTPLSTPTGQNSSTTFTPNVVPNSKAPNARGSTKNVHFGFCSYSRSQCEATLTGIILGCFLLAALLVSVAVIMRKRQIRHVLV
uniref:integumentary mucin C.1-like n=1 Tax=Ciona intestinalis TaxID=7719 RepID=UPI00089DCBAC|nr:integumentary mucin C.1-like [Ciona intestinalis]XP_026689563.1 integumentary mucin C.1-like [Ciona intestinalis]|eukprot:XP_018666657.1 integumentary mucin C.1-like [Ciona intestinalis]